MHFRVKRKGNRNHILKQIYVRISANSIMVCIVHLLVEEDRIFP